MVAAQPAASEYAIKATFLFNFTQFVEWPPDSMADVNAPFVIGILGPDPFGRFLDDLVKDEHVDGKRIEVRRLDHAEQADDCQLVFISRVELPHLASILEALNRKPVLTVSESGDPTFTRQGGMIGLVVDHGRVRVRINLEAARAAGLTISAKLLRLAEIVRTEGS